MLGGHPINGPPLPDVEKMAKRATTPPLSSTGRSLAPSFSPGACKDGVLAFLAQPMATGCTGHPCAHRAQEKGSLVEMVGFAQ